MFAALPPKRAGSYLSARGNDPLAALALYRWNTQVSGSLHETLGHFEVMFRNEIDAALTGRYIFNKWGGDWLDDGRCELTAAAVEAIADARAFAGGRSSARKAASVDRGSVIAELNLNFWRRLLDARYESVHGGAVMRRFPSLKVPQKRNNDMSGLRQLVDPLYSLRNRIAHYEPVWSLHHAARRDDAMRLIADCDPDMSVWVQRHCRLDALLTTKP